MQLPRRGTPDFLLLLLTFLLVGFGLVMVFSASSAKAIIEHGDKLHFIRKQVLFAAMGVAVMFIAMNVNYNALKKLIIPLLVFVFAMLVAVLFRDPIYGANRLFMLGSFGIQPAELAKPIIIFYLAAVIDKKREKFRDFKTGLLPPLIIVGIIAVLILLEPDLGTCIVYLFGAVVVITVGGAKFKQLFAVGTLVGILVAISLIFKYFRGDGFGYQGGRIASFQDPWADPLDSGWQIIQSLYAFGHGGLYGAGFGQSIQKLFYLPEAYNDFIFAIIGEELGFVGITIFLMIYIAFIWRALIVSVRSSALFGTLIGAGIVGMFGIQALINIAAVTGVIPITGITLPFISYGGSSLLVSMMSVGVLLSISRDSTRPEQSEQALTQ